MILERWERYGRFYKNIKGTDQKDHQGKRNAKDIQYYEEG